tara:strand:+ start:262 stop:1935 length:1674 start_codon:yes stop_codon:yes gene_type:complete
MGEKILTIKAKLETSEFKKGQKEVNEGITENTEAVDGMSSALDKMTGGAITGFKKMVSGAKAGVLAMKTLKGAIAATGIGLLVVAVGSLISYFTSTQKGADMIDKAFAGIGATIDVLVDRLSTFGGGLMKIFDGKFSEGLDILAGSFKGITKEIKEEANAAVELETASQNLLLKKREFIEQEAKLNADLQKYRLASEDFEKSTAERLEANKMAQETAMKLANERTAIAEEELRILEAKNGLGESLNEDLDAEAEAKAKLFEIEGERDALAKEFQAKAKSITDEEKSKAATAAAEKLAAQKELSAEELEQAKELAEKLEKVRLEEIKKVDNQIRQYKLENNDIALEDLLVFEQLKRDLELEQLNLTEEEKEAIRLSYLEKEKQAKAEANAAQAKQGDDSVAIEKSKEAAKGKLISDGFKLAGDLAGKNAKAQKGIAAAEATFSTYAAIAGQLKAFAGVPVPGYAIAQAVATGVFGMAQVAKILSTNTSSPSVSSPSSGGSVSSPSQSQTDNNIPNFDFINQGVGGNAGNALNRNYVVLQDIKDKEILNEKINDLSVTG